MSDHELPILRRELARHRAINAEMLAALQTTRLQLHASFAGKNALSNDKHLSIVEAAIAQAEAAGIKAEG